MLVLTSLLSEALWFISHTLFFFFYIMDNSPLDTAVKRQLTGRIWKRLQLLEVHVSGFMVSARTSQASVPIDLHIKYISNKTTSCWKPIVKSIVIGTKILWVLGLQSGCL